jgi:sortase B
MPTGGKQTKTSITNAQKRKINFTALKKKNKDIVAWISIPNTPIDYAVLKTGNNSYYLKRNAIKKPSSSGAIFLDSAAKADFSSKDSIVYGHRMKDRTMFGSLISYKNSKHRKSHQYVFVYTPKATKKYRVSECFRTSSKKLTPKNAKVRTLSLVTCDDAKGKVHYIVRAKLVSSKKPGKK